MTDSNEPQPVGSTNTGERDTCEHCRATVTKRYTMSIPNNTGYTIFELCLTCAAKAWGGQSNTTQETRNHE